MRAPDVITEIVPPCDKNVRDCQRPGGLLGFIQDHFNVTPPKKPEDQVAREKWLLPGVKFNRWFIVPAAAVLIQFCIGSMYAWSVLNEPIDELIYGHFNNMSPICFYIACGFLGCSAAVMGPWLERNGPHRACLLGIALFCSGHFVTAVALYLRSIWLVFFGYGVLGGMGTGICYISPVSTLQKWFPDKRGLASGLAVCGFGGGSVVISKVLGPLMDAVGLPLMFVVLGGSYLVVMTLSALVLRTPPPDFMIDRGPDRGNEAERTDKQVVCYTNGCDYKNTVVKIQPTLIDCLVSADFRLCYIVFFGNTFFALCVISRLSSMVTGIFGRSPAEAATIVAINSGFNLIGRLLYPITSEYIGRKNCFLVMVTTQLVIVATFSTIVNSGTYWLFVVAMWTLTLCYGGGFGTIPAFLTDMFGESNVGACHGVILTAWSLGSVAGGFIYTGVFDLVVASGYDKTSAHPYNVNSWWMSGVVAVAWIALQFVTPTEKDLWFRHLLTSGCSSRSHDRELRLARLRNQV